MIELELHPLKYEVNYKNKCYIIEAVDYFNNTDETKWIVTLEGNKLRKAFRFTYMDIEHNCDTHIDTFFNTKDEAVNVLTTYLVIEDRLEKERAEYTSILELPFLYSGKNVDESISGDFLSVHDVEAALNKKGCFKISKSNRDCVGVQVSVTYIANMLLLEKVIAEIAKDNNCKIINIYNHDVPHCNYSTPLYYYWQCGNDFVRQFALLKHLF
jgi:hypothetical protein